MYAFFLLPIHAACPAHLILYLITLIIDGVVERSNERVCGCSLAGTAGSNPTEARISVLSVVCCQIEVSAMDRSLVQRSFIDCGGYYVESRNLKNEAVLARVGLLCQWKK